MLSQKSVAAWREACLTRDEMTTAGAEMMGRLNRDQGQLSRTGRNHQTTCPEVRGMGRRARLPTVALKYSELARWAASAVVPTNVCGSRAVSRHAAGEEERL
jgi:hypothetical protein